MSEKVYLLPESLHTALLAYLESRPYKEVAQGVAALNSLKEATPVDQPQPRTVE